MVLYNLLLYFTNVERIIMDEKFKECDVHLSLAVGGKNRSREHWELEDHPSWESFVVTRVRAKCKIRRFDIMYRRVQL